MAAKLTPEQEAERIAYMREKLKENPLLSANWFKQNRDWGVKILRKLALENGIVFGKGVSQGWKTASQKRRNHE